MLIREFEKENPDWDIYDQETLSFVEEDNEEEAVQNIEYVFQKYADLETLSVVMKSYSGHIMPWENW